MNSLKSCPRCGRENDLDAVSCAGCGAPAFDRAASPPDQQPPCPPDAPSGGSLKLPRTSGLGKFLSWGPWVALMLACSWFIMGTFGCVSDDGYVPPNHRWLSYTPIPLLLAAVLFALRSRFDGEYLLDTERRRLIYQSKFLGVRQSRVLLEGADIAAVTVQARKAEHNEVIRWEYRAVAVGTDGRAVALTNWLCDGLDDCNAAGARLAKTLACPFHEAPPKSETVIRASGGTVSIHFVPAIWGMTRFDRWVYLIVALVIAAAVVLGLLAIRSVPPH